MALQIKDVPHAPHQRPTRAAGMLDFQRLVERGRKRGWTVSFGKDIDPRLLHRG